MPSFSTEPQRRLAELKKSLQHSAEYCQLPGSNEKILARQNFFKEFSLQTPIWQQLDRLINRSTLIKHDKTSTVVKAVVGEKRVIIKRYNKRGAIHTLKMLVAPTRAEKVFFRTLLLRALDIPTSEPLLYCVEKRHGIPTFSYLITDCFSGETLCDLYDKGRLTSSEWNVVANKVADVIDRLHRHRITHGDIKTPNLLYNGAALEIVDLDALRFHKTAASLKRFSEKDRASFDARVRRYPERGGVK